MTTADLKKIEQRMIEANGITVNSDGKYVIPCPPPTKATIDHMATLGFRPVKDPEGFWYVERIAP